MTLTYGVSAQSGAAADTALFLNGAPLGRKPAGSAGLQSLPIQVELVPGTNELVLAIGTADVRAEAAAAPPRPAPADLFASLALELDRSTVSGDTISATTEELDRVEWTPDAGTPVQLPHRLALRFEAPADTTPPIWLNAPPLDPTGVRDRIVMRVAELGRLLAAGEIDRFAFAMGLRYRETARAYPLRGDVEAIRAQDIRMLARLARQPGFRLLPVGDQGAVPRGYAGNRLVEAVAPDGGALLRATIAGDPNPIEFPMLFAMIDGKLEVVR